MNASPYQSDNYAPIGVGFSYEGRLRIVSIRSRTSGIRHPDIRSRAFGVGQQSIRSRAFRVGPTNSIQL